MQKNRSMGLASLFSFILCAAVGFAQESKGFKPGVSIKLTGGGSGLAVGDINSSLGSIDRRLSSMEWRAYSTEKVMQLNNRIGSWDAELKFDFTERLGLGIAVSNAVHLSNASRIPLFSSLADAGSPTIGSFTSAPDVRVRMPIRLSIYYSLPVISRLTILLSTGVGYYSGIMKESLDYEISDFLGTAWYRSEWQTQWKASLGFHGGLGAEYHLSKRLAFVVEAQYRFVKIGNFKATMSADSNLWQQLRNYDPEGTLYLWSWGEDGPIGISYRELIVWSGIPPDYGASFGGSVRGKAKLDLSGISLRLGIRLGLF